MSLINSTAIPSGVATGYQIANSARFNGTSTKLTRTPSSTGNRRMLTFSAWIKQGDVNESINGNAFFSAGVNGDKFSYQSGSKFRISGNVVFTAWGTRDWDGVQRDAGGWKHIVVRYDTAQGNELARSRLFINGVEAPVNYTYSTITQNYETRYNHTADAHWLGALNNGAYFDGYMAEVHWIDGAIVSPNAFGEVGDYGEWKPKEYVPGDYAAYGTNGYYLNFADSSHFGKDVSGNGNNWTDTGFGTHDQMLDSPTNNFAVFNPVMLAPNMGTQITEGNLKNYEGSTHGGYPHNSFSTMAVTSGKWYFETKNTTVYGYVGIYDLDFGGALPNDIRSPVTNPPSDYSGGYGVDISSGVKENNNSRASYGSGIATGDKVMCAFDVDAGKIWWGKNGTWFASGNPATAANPAYTGQDFGNACPFVTTQDGSTSIINFGQDSTFAGTDTNGAGASDSGGVGDFYYAPPSGFKSLCTSNLPSVAVVPSENFNTVLYDGSSSTPLAVTGVGFTPDLVWLKQRTSSATHGLFSILNGAGASNGYQYLQSDKNDAESRQWGEVTFDSDGWSGVDSAYNGSFAHDFGQNGKTFVSWNWKANGSGASNTNGSINTTKTSANVAAGFSIGKYTGTGSAATIGHGLSSAPEMVIIKSLDASEDWAVFHIDIAAGQGYATLNTTDAPTTGSSRRLRFGNDTDGVVPDSTKIYIGSNGMVNTSNNDYLAYAFHSVDGYSKVGKYTGNGSTNGAFVNTGFRPQWIMVKNIGGSGNSWSILDTKRNTFNPMNKDIAADSSDAEYSRTTIYTDVTSNGFKFRGTNSWTNSNDVIYIYIAFAETPFKYSNAR